MKKFLTCYLVLVICTAQPTAASKWHYLLPPLARSLRHINDQPRVSYSSHSSTSSDNPWNYIMPFILIAGGAYLLWPFFREIDSTFTTPPRFNQSKPHSNDEPIILANFGGVLIR